MTYKQAIQYALEETTKAKGRGYVLPSKLRMVFIGALIESTADMVEDGDDENLEISNVLSDVLDIQ